MKKKLVISLIVVIIAWYLLAISTPAKADVYVKVDSNGVAIGGPIMCDGLQCGNPNSEYSKLTLQAGERYVLQGTGQAGIGNNNPNTEVKVDLQTNVWTVTNTESQQVVQQFTPQTNPANPPAPVVVPSPIPQNPVDSGTATIDTNTAVVDTKTATTIVGDSLTASVNIQPTTNTTYTAITQYLDNKLRQGWKFINLLRRRYQIEYSE